MYTKKSHINKLTGYVRQLCSLNLDSAITIPSAVAALRQMIGADWAGFVWANSKGLPCAMRCENEEVFKTWPHYEELRKKGQVSPIIGDFEEWMTFKKPAPNTCDIDKRVLRSSAFFNEVVEPTQTYHFFKVVVHSKGIGLGHTLMGRFSADKEFSPEDARLIADFNTYLAHALARPEKLGLEYLDSELSAMVLTDHKARIIHKSNNATQLLALANDETFLLAEREKLPPVAYDLIKRLQLIMNGQPAAAATEYITNRWGRFILRAYESDCRAGTYFFNLQHQEPRQLAIVNRAFRLGLSIQQQAICLKLTSGKSQDFIAHQLNIKKSTVIDHIRCIYQKLNISNVRELEQTLLTNEL